MTTFVAMPPPAAVQSGFYASCCVLNACSDTKFHHLADVLWSGEGAPGVVENWKPDLVLALKACLWLTLLVVEYKKPTVKDDDAKAETDRYVRLVSVYSVLRLLVLGFLLRSVHALGGFCLSSCRW